MKSMSIDRPKSVNELDEPLGEWETARREISASLLWTNHNLLAQDFPDLRIEQSQEFVLSNAAVVSESLTRPNQVVSFVPYGDSVEVFRPPRYGRSLVIEFARPSQDDSLQLFRGIFDVKGVGPKSEPILRNHATGILPLPLAIEELVNQRIVEGVMEALNYDVSGVPVYGIIDLGFEGWIPEIRRPLPCAALVRQGHRRPVGGIDLPAFNSNAHHAQLQLELVLRRFGISSVTPMTTFQIERGADGRVSSLYGGHPVDGLGEDETELVLRKIGKSLSCGQRIVFGGINVQLTRHVDLNPIRCQLVDFGHYCEVDSRIDRLLCMVADRPLNWGGDHDVEALMGCNGSREDTPLGRLMRLRNLTAVEAAHFGVEETYRVTDITHFAFDLTSEYASGRLDRMQLQGSIDKFIHDAVDLVSHGKIS